MYLRRLLDFTASVPLIYGKECGEYSEEIKDYLGNRGEIITIRAKQHNKYIPLNLPGGFRYVYHTVVKLREQGVDYIIDVFHREKVIVHEKYMNELYYINNTSDFEITPGGFKL